ncbi:MAG TPA: hypothetical protein VGE37_15715 [Archangium sp.]
MPKLVSLAVVLLAAHAFADGRSASLLGDAPRVALAAAPRLLEAAAGAPDVKQAPAAVEGIGYGEHFVKTSAVGVASTVTGVLLGAGFGALSNNLIAAAVPVLLMNLFVPPIITVLAAMLIGNWDTPGRFGFWLPMVGAFVVNAAAYVISSLLLVVPWTNPAALLAYAFIDGILMGGTTVGLMHLTQKKDAPVVKSFVPGVTDTTLVALMEVPL